MSPEEFKGLNVVIQQLSKDVQSIRSWVILIGLIISIPIVISLFSLFMMILVGASLRH